MAARRAKGLCFRCDERFTPGHRCASNTLQVLLVDDDEEEGTGGEESSEEEHAHLEAAEVSSNSVVGLTPPHTMRLRGSIGETQVVVLIDSGATHNFISQRVVGQSNLKVTQNGSRGVILGNGKIEESRGICKNVILTLQGVQIIEDFLPLELGSTDVILGIKWLQTLGNMVVNWKELTMVFGEEKVTIRGDPSLCRSQVSIKAICRALQKDNTGYIIEMTCRGEPERTQTGGRRSRR